MLISEMIQRLEALKEENGDLLIVTGTAFSRKQIYSNIPVVKQAVDVGKCKSRYIKIPDKVIHTDEEPNYKDRPKTIKVVQI